MIRISLLVCLVAGPPSPRLQAADLASYFGAGPDAGVDGGRPEAALFLRLRREVESGADGGADEGLVALAAEYPALADRCLAQAGLAAAARSDWAAAVARLTRVDVDSLRLPDARLVLSKALREQGRLAEAKEALAPIASRPAPESGRDVGAEALLALADLAKAGRDSKGERAALIDLWTRHPTSDLAADAERRLGGAEKASAAEAVTRAEALIDAHRNQAGIDLLAPRLVKLSMPDPLACRAHFLYGKGLRKEREHTRAAAVLGPVVDRCKEPELRARALYTLGQSRAIVDLAHAGETYDRLAKDYPGHRFADDALFYAADAYVKVGNLDRAISRLDELVQKYPDGDFAAEGLFKAFWIRRAQKRPADAAAYLDQIDGRYAAQEETYEVDRSRYWRARAAEDGGDRPKAAALLEALAAEHPATYYGLAARWRLGPLDPDGAARASAAAAPESPVAEPWSIDPGSLARSRHFTEGVELLRLGFSDEASSELEAVDRTALPADGQRLLAHVLAAAGDARAAHSVARTSLRAGLVGRITRSNRAVWELAYPRVYRDLVERHSRAAGSLEPDLLQALVREESALDPSALSWAGALGLTQLMPATALAVAADLKAGKVSPAALLEPDTNLRLGAAYLGSLVRRYSGVRQLALAGYNAGESAVDRWRRERPTEELDAWVEDIPLAETRGYVKRVLRSYNTYQLLYPAP